MTQNEEYFNSPDTEIVKNECLSFTIKFPAIVEVKRMKNRKNDTVIIKKSSN